MDEDQIVRLLSECKSKIWEDKKRLTLTNYKQRRAARETHKLHLVSGSVSTSLSTSRQKSPYPPTEAQDCKKTERISKLSSSDGIVCIGDQIYVNKKISPQITPVLPCDVLDTKKEELIEKLNSSSIFVGLGEKQTTKTHSSPNFTSVPVDVRAIKKEALISKLSSPEGLSGLGERKKRSLCRATSPLPEDVREIKKDELISKFTTSEELAYLGRQVEKGYLRSRSPSPLPDDVRKIKKDELISKFSTAEGLAHLGEQKKQKSPHCISPLPEDVRDHKKDELISSLTSTQGLVAEREDWSEEIESMVRFGEYSPQNPGLLSPGKTLLGLGEYEEKRRQILERKKREYLEQMAYVRQTVKDMKYQPESYEYATKSSLNNVGCQTDLKITGYVDDESGLSPIAVSTQTPGGEVPIDPSFSSYSHNNNISTQTSGGNIRFPKIVPATIVSSPGSGPAPQQYFPLSPRERKMAEFRESYSPSFLQGLPVRQGVFEMSSEPDMRKRREAYQEELRKQIEEKRRIEAEEQEKECRKEAAIARRAELQRERMKQEYIQEEARRREKQLQRMQQADEFQRKQEALKLQAELEREAKARRKLEKRLEQLEAGLEHHTPLTSQALGVSLPVPALRSKLTKETTSHENQKVTEDVMLLEDIASEDKQENIVVNDNLVHDPEHENHKDKTKYSPQFSESEYTSRHSEYNFNKHPALRDSNEAVTYSYHRPPTEIIRAAGYSENVPSLYDENKNSQNRHSRTSSENAEVQQEGTGNKNTLENKMSIPILRAPSPVIPTARLGNAASGSEAMRKLEGKWQVPAVEKTVVNTDPNPNSILTQLGAVRHQLQLEQMRMEQHLQQRLKHKS